MIRRVSEFYSYLFQEEQGITVAYFKTKFQDFKEQLISNK